MAKKGKKPKRTTNPSSQIKGNVLEDLVARIYEAPELTVKTRQQVPVPGDNTRTREIDVLVTGIFAGYPTQIAIECKNYALPVGVEKIDAFVGKLEELRIPAQYGIFVAANGFEAGAIPRARAAGIRTLVLDGLTPERMAAEVREALQSVVYLLPVVQSITVTTDGEVLDGSELLWLRDEEGQMCGSVLDIIWAKWRDAEMPMELGEHRLNVVAPRGWHWAAEDGSSVVKAEATVKVVGLAVADTGEVRTLVLKDAGTGQLDRGRAEISFPQSPNTLSVTTAETEEELSRLLDKPANAKITIGKIQLPRIVYKIYWPPSTTALTRLQVKGAEAFRDAYQGWKASGGAFDPISVVAQALQSATLEEIEGTVLNAIWEPIDPRHPASRDDRWPYGDGER